MEIDIIKNLPDFKFIRSLEVFDGLPDETVMEFFSRFSKRFFGRGQHIFRQGETVNSLYFMEMGTVKIYKHDSSSKRLTLWFVERGGVFCLANLFAPASFASALAVTDCLAFVIEKEDLLGIVSGNSVLMDRMLCCLSGKLSSYLQLIEMLSFKKVEQRLAYLLANSSSCGSYGCTFCNMTQSQIASMIGTSREVVCRLMKKFARQKLIEVKRQGKGQLLEVKNLEGLKELAGDEDL